MTTSVDLGRLLTAEEVAELFGLSLSAIRLMTRRRELPIVRVTGRRSVRYPLVELQRLLHERLEPAGGRRLRTEARAARKAREGKRATGARGRR